MGFWDSDEERGYKFGKEHKEKIERGEAGFFELLDEIAIGMPIGPPEYGEGFNRAMQEPYTGSRENRKSEKNLNNESENSYNANSYDNNSYSSNNETDDSDEEEYSYHSNENNNSLEKIVSKKEEVSTLGTIVQTLVVGVGLLILLGSLSGKDK